MSLLTHIVPTAKLSQVIPDSHDYSTTGQESWWLDMSTPPFAEYPYTTIHSTKGVRVMIPASTLFDQSTISALLEHDPLVQDYRAFFALFDWSVVDDWQAQRSGRG